MSGTVFLPIFSRPHRLAWPRTLPFQGSNTGSNPVGDTSFLQALSTEAVLYFVDSVRETWTAPIQVHDPARGRHRDRRGQKQQMYSLG